MIRSMTGYGRAAVEGGGSPRLVVEIGSVNRKNLDIAISMPREWQRLEPAVGEVLRKRVFRGRLNVSVTLEAPGGGEAEMFPAVEIEKALVELARLGEKLKVPFEPDAKLLLDIAVSLRNRTGAPEAEAVEEPLLAAVDQAAAEMVAMREREGEAIRQDLANRAGELRERLGRIRETAGGAVVDYRETLLKRLRASGLEFSLEDERVLKEIAIFADRCDISEEVTRLESHFGQFAEFLEAENPVGRKFEFLLQEIGREFNTIGSKAADSAISREVIECKNELERIREQILNVE